MVWIGLIWLRIGTSGGLLGWDFSPSQSRYLHTEQHKQNKPTQISMPRAGFKPTIPVFKRAKTVHALDRAATLIGKYICDATHYKSQFHTLRSDEFTQ
jgi:hypothetical protein